MNAKISTIFLLKTTKENSKGLTPIYLRITVNGKRFEISTNKFIEKTKWSSETKKMKGNSEEARSINEYLKILETNIYEAQKSLLLESKEINFDTIRNRVLKKDESNYYLNEKFEEHNNQIKLLIGFNYSESTYKRFETAFNHFKTFLNSRYSLSNIPLKNIDIEMIMNFDYYLRTTKNCNNNSTIKYVKLVGKIIRNAHMNGWIKSNPFINYDAKLKIVDRIYLTEQEIETILNKQFVIPRLELVRDIFIFSCFTGLAYIDVQQLTKDNIGIGIDGNKWIFKNRQKTDTTSKIPLLPVAEMIIQKYVDSPEAVNKSKLLPILSNQKMNAYLKEIADVCGINKDLTFHIARHTFATTVTLSNGVPLETVSKMLGHTNLKTTQHYAKVLDHKISNDMAELKSKMKSFTFPLKKASNV